MISYPFATVLTVRGRGTKRCIGVSYVPPKKTNHRVFFFFFYNNNAIFHCTTIPSLSNEFQKKEKVQYPRKLKDTSNPNHRYIYIYISF